MIRLKWFALSVAIVLCGLLPGCAPEAREEIVISMPESDYIRSIDTNYYKLWLEEQTGLSIQFNIIRDIQTPERLRSVFSSGLQTDAFFSIFGSDAPDGMSRVLQELGEDGYILPLNDYVEESVHLNAIFDHFPAYDLRSAMTSPDGNIYYMPGFDPSISQSNFQVMWINQSWLKALKLSVPGTTDELRETLIAFRDNDPNGNGQRDEIPLAGSKDVASEQCYNFIINAFVYNDPANSRLFVEDGSVKFAPVTAEWREAMQYLNELYSDGLISPFQFELGNVGLEGLANDPENLLGGFTSRFINDVIFPSNREVAHNYVHVAPLVGSDGTHNATVRTPAPTPAGIITSSCDNPEAVFKLFDLMLSEEAFLIGRYGEEGVDWNPAGGLDVDFYGDAATVKVVNQLWGEMQNKHLAELGPFFAYPEYANGVTFSANDLDPHYVDARAYRTYEPFQPTELIRYRDEGAEAINSYTDNNIEAFITGEKDPFDDTAWQTYVDGFDDRGLEQLVQSAQAAYDAQKRSDVS
ncbi:MAG: extracellular solute-binding protein [Oscillospiraceae bacterium]|jgi:ABC-type glycerol-3-phosphate transport system substrate-binding protein|nr:extracellular solute-binding protein [Oscillospiraceae bacterium]